MGWDERPRSSAIVVARHDPFDEAHDQDHPASKASDVDHSFSISVRPLGSPTIRCAEFDAPLMLSAAGLKMLIPNRPANPMDHGAFPTLDFWVDKSSSRILDAVRAEWEAPSDH